LYNDWEYSPQWLRICHCENIAESNKSKVIYSAIFEEYLTKCNYTINYLSNGPEFELPKIEPSYHYGDIEDILDEQTYQKIQKKIELGSATLIDRRRKDKYIFQKRISSRTPEHVKVELFDYYFGCKNPDRQVYFFNIYAEKFSSTEEILARESQHRFAEFSSERAMMLDLITGLNSLMGCNNSQEGFSVCEQLLPNTDNQLIPIIRRAVEAGVTTTAKDPIQQRSKMIQGIYKRFADVKIDHGRYRPRDENGKHQNFTTLIVTGNMNLWNYLIPVDGSITDRQSSRNIIINHLSSDSTPVVAQL